MEDVIELIEIDETLFLEEAFQLTEKLLIIKNSFTSTFGCEMSLEKITTIQATSLEHVNESKEAIMPDPNLN